MPDPILVPPNPSSKYKLIYISVLVLLVVLLGAGALIYQKYNSNKKSSPMGFAVNITKAGNQAFGNLTAVSGQEKGTPSAAVPQAASSALAPNTSVSSMFVPLPNIFYTYKYTGDDLNLSDTQLDVFQKQKTDTSQFTNDLGAFGMGLVDLNSFSGNRLQSVSIGQDQGYNTYIDFTSGSISISGNLAHVVPLTVTNSAGAASSGSASVAPLYCIKDGPPCGQPAPPPVAIPDDATLIGIAQKFVSYHNISLTTYGSPQVVNDNYYNILRTKTPDSSLGWPSEVSVVFPLNLNGNVVYDETGSPVGLTINIDLQSQQVDNVWGLEQENYQSSSYDAETDSSRILTIAQKGGLYGYAGDSDQKTVELDLGTPTKQLVQMWDYSVNQNQELLVPALVFPITNPPADANFSQQYVVVPLIKQILDNNDNTTTGGPIMYPMVKTQ